ncbi:MAG: hypothetical protein ABR577_07930 [Pyrinomonadaceae bacterium]
MNKLKIALFCVMLSCAGVFAGCRGGGSQPQSGFRARGEKYVSVLGGDYMFVSAANVSGRWQFDNGSAVGNTTSFGPTLCIGGPCTISDGRVPARWRIIAGLPGECIGQLTNPDVDISAGQAITARCLTFGLLVPFSATPSSVNLQTPPPTFEMTGSDLDTIYGMPYVEYVDQYTGDLIGSATATTVSSDGTWLQANMPDLSSVYSGTYNVLVSNVQADGSLQYVGTSTMDAYGRDGVYEPPPDPDPCSCPSNMECMPCNNY